jgi:hypothetical protein
MRSLPRSTLSPALAGMRWCACLGSRGGAAREASRRCEPEAAEESSPQENPLGVTPAGSFWSAHPGFLVGSGGALRLFVCQRAGVHGASAPLAYVKPRVIARRGYRRWRRVERPPYCRLPTPWGRTRRVRPRFRCRARTCIGGPCWAISGAGRRDVGGLLERCWRARFRGSARSRRLAAAPAPGERGTHSYAEEDKLTKAMIFRVKFFT